VFDEADSEKTGVDNGTLSTIPSISAVAIGARLVNANMLNSISPAAEIELRFSEATKLHLRGGRSASGLAAAVAPKEEFSGTVLVDSYLESTTNYIKETIMKFATIALASVLALSGTAALANTVHHKSIVRTDRDAVGRVHLHPNYGNPNGDPDGPTSLSGTGDSSFGGSSPGTTGYN
jgi:hypothetical protein